MAARFISPWTIFRSSPWRNRAFIERLRFVGDDEVRIEVYGVAKTLAAWAGTVGIIEREEIRNWFFERQAVEFEAIGEGQFFYSVDFQLQGTLAFIEGGAYGVGDAMTVVFVEDFGDQPVDENADAGTYR